MTPDTRARFTLRLPKLSREEGRIVFLLLGLKVLLVVFGIVTYNVYANKYPPTFTGYLEVWNGWDAPNYQDIAANGYPITGDKRFNLAFLPFFPLLIRAVMITGLSPFLSSLVVSGIASLLIGVLLYRLARLDYKLSAARRAVWFQFIFPTAYFLHIGLTESLFIALVLGAFLAARKRYWGIAGLLGFFVGMTRINGLFLLPALCLEALTEYRETRRFNKNWISIASVALGFGVYLLLNYRITGNAFAFLQMQQEHWSHQPAWPWTGMYNALQFTHWSEPANAQMTGFQEFSFSLLSLIAAIVCCIKMRPSYGFWIFANWFLFTSADFLNSTPRYALILFPMFLLLGNITRRRTVFLALTVTSLLFYGFFACLYAQGKWAF